MNTPRFGGEWDDCEVHVLNFAMKPMTTNRERAGNRWARAEMTRLWRTTASLLCRQNKVPKAEFMLVVVKPHQKKGRLQDVAACNPSLKAVIDGVVDAGVIPDDSGEFVREVRFLPVDRTEDGMTVTLVLKPKKMPPT